MDGLYFIFIPLLYAVFGYTRQQMGAPSAALDYLGRLDATNLAGFGFGQMSPASGAVTAKPGTPEFREAIRQALLSEKELAASQGVYNFTEKDRYGLDDRARILQHVLVVIIDPGSGDSASHLHHRG